MKNKKMIWRDDDISYETDLKKFSLTQDVFNKYGVKHTIALVCQDIEKSPELIQYILDNDIDVQIHCWDHTDMTLNTDTLEVELLKCIKVITSLFGKIPTTVYPPWNKTNAKVEKIAADLNLVVRADKISLQQYIRTNGDVAEDTVNFHYWAYENERLAEALKIYTS